MSAIVRLTASFGNVDRDAYIKSFPEQLATKFPSVQVYRFSPPPNVILASGIEWQGFIGTTADVLGIATFFWMTWEKLLSKARRSSGANRSEPVLLIQLNPGNRKFKQLAVQESDTKKEEFIRRLAAAIEELQDDSSDSLQSGEEEAKQVTKNPNWVRVKRHNIAR